MSKIKNLAVFSVGDFLGSAISAGFWLCAVQGMITSPAECPSSAVAGGPSASDPLAR